jgi:hypothetical protein
MQNKLRGFMMSVTNEKVYDLKEKYYGKAFQGSKDYFKIGNELSLYSNMQF